MNGWTPLAKSLLESARHEAPSAAAKAKVWSGVAASFAVGGATTGAVASIAPPAVAAVAGGGLATLASAKMLFIGALLGSAATLGIAATTFYGRGEPLAPLPPSGAIAPMALQAAHAMSLASPLSPVAPVAPLPLVPPVRETVSPSVTPDLAIPPRAEVTAPPPVPRPVSTVRPTSTTRALATTPPRDGSKAPSGDAPPGSDVGADALMQEASWVAEARNCIRRGDPSAALAAIREARALPSHQLAPEESGLEAQALRAIARAKAAVSAAPIDSTRPPHP